ncbi:hypothetical protein C8F04DRAFT_1301477 [Mycena alexandri]|uniref:Uncharacterized protein n=1 Tax=Mycena alexandri TaxID=1745969 RepID=A0AAD6SCA8_9AGAR|nr:hypothetical protein C8F04DRAFT_1301477 [Mycena alexandri]
MIRLREKEFSQNLKRHTAELTLSAELVLPVAPQHLVVICKPFYMLAEAGRDLILDGILDRISTDEAEHMGPRGLAIELAMSTRRLAHSKNLGSRTWNRAKFHVAGDALRLRHGGQEILGRVLEAEDGGENFAARDEEVRVGRVTCGSGDSNPERRAHAASACGGFRVPKWVKLPSKLEAEVLRSSDVACALIETTKIQASLPGQIIFSRRCRAQNENAIRDEVYVGRTLNIKVRGVKIKEGVRVLTETRTAGGELDAVYVDLRRTSKFGFPRGSEYKASRGVLGRRIEPILAISTSATQPHLPIIHASPEPAAPFILSERNARAAPQSESPDTRAHSDARERRMRERPQRLEECFEWARLAREERGVTGSGCRRQRVARRVPPEFSRPGRCRKREGDVEVIASVAIDGVGGERAVGPPSAWWWEGGFRILPAQDCAAKLMYDTSTSMDGGARLPRHPMGQAET